MLTVARIRRPAVLFCYAAALAMLAVRPVAATTYNTLPYPTRVLPGSEQFLARDSGKSLALYRLADLSLVRRFQVRFDIDAFTVTSDDRVLLISSNYYGILSAFDIPTGKQYWELSPSQGSLSSTLYPHLCFCQHGQHILVRGSNGYSIIETTTGRLTRSVPAPVRVEIASAALRPDGTGGVLVGGNGELYEFEVGTGKVMKTGRKISGHVWYAAYSMDGNYVALLARYGFDEVDQPRIVKVGNGWPIRDVGPLRLIGHIKPTPDGGFLLTDLQTTGLRWRPQAQDLEELWRLPNRSSEPERMDFFPDKLIGVRTNYRFVTQVVDLRTGTILGSVDNSANYRPRMVTTTRFGVLDDGTWLVGAVVAAATWIAVRLVIRRRQDRRSLHPSE